MYRANQKRSAIVEGHFYPWKALLAISVVFTVLSLIPIVPRWLQVIFQMAGIAGAFLGGGRWMYDRVIFWFVGSSELLKEYEQGIDGAGRKKVKEDLKGESVSHIYTQETDD